MSDFPPSDAMMAPGCELQDKTRHITLAQGRPLGTLAQSCVASTKASRAPLCSLPLPPTDNTTQLEGVVQGVMTAALSECFLLFWYVPCAAAVGLRRY